jgi:hypothetical protein
LYRIREGSVEIFQGARRVRPGLSGRDDMWGPPVSGRRLRIGTGWCQLGLKVWDSARNEAATKMSLVPVGATNRG